MTLPGTDLPADGTKPWGAPFRSAWNALRAFVKGHDELVTTGRLSEKSVATAVSTAIAVARRPGVTALRGMAPVTDVGQFGDNLSNGTDTQQMTRASYLTTRATKQMSLAYINWRWDGIGENVLTGTATVRASIEVGGVTYPVFFAGRRDAVMEPESIIVTDPVSIELAAGATFFVRTYVTVPSGTFPANRILNNVIRPGEGVESGTAITDKTLSGTVATTAARGFTPTYILADARQGAPVVAAIGDSIVFGNADNGVGGTTDRGFMSRAFAGSGVAFMKMGAPGDKPSLFKTWANSRRRRNLIPGVSHAVFYFGINDLRNGVPAATVQADLLSIWAWMTSMGIKVYACTIGPKSTSTDNWATTENQTVDTYNTERVAFNNWIRGVPSPLSGFFEVADTMESARDSGKWKVNGSAGYATTDGLHPSTPIHQLMAAAVTPATFTL